MDRIRGKRCVCVRVRVGRESQRCECFHGIYFSSLLPFFRLAGLLKG